MAEYQGKLGKHYRPLLEEHKDTYRAVDWGSERGQQVRFHILAQVGELGGASVLDVGCGVGHFVDVLVRSGFAGEYQGIDILPEMVAAAKSRHLEREFAVGNILEEDGGWKAEYVIGSGLFTFSDQGLFHATVRAMFAACGQAVAFNSLSSRSEDKEPGEFHADPAETLAFCQTLTPWVSLRHDYFPHDFTVYMYRAAQA